MDMLDTFSSLVCWHTIFCKKVKSMSCLLNTQNLVCFRRDIESFYCNWIPIHILYFKHSFSFIFWYGFEHFCHRWCGHNWKNLPILSSLVCWHTIFCKNVKSMTCLLNMQSLVCLRRELKILIVIGFLFNIFISFIFEKKIRWRKSTDHDLLKRKEKSHW